MVDPSGSGGRVFFFIPHTTAGITVNGHAALSVADDITAQLEAMPPEHLNYYNVQGNAPTHIKTSLLSNSNILLVESSKLVLVSVHSLTCYQRIIRGNLVVKRQMLQIDLSNRSYEVQEIPEEIIRKYMGGLRAYLLYKLVPAKADPLGEENHLIFTAGPANRHFANPFTKIF